MGAVPRSAVERFCLFSFSPPPPLLPTLPFLPPIPPTPKIGLGLAHKCNGGFSNENINYSVSFPVEKWVDQHWGVIIWTTPQRREIFIKTSLRQDGIKGRKFPSLGKDSVNLCFDEVLSTRTTFQFLQIFVIFNTNQWKITNGTGFVSKSLSCNSKWIGQVKEGGRLTSVTDSLSVPRSPIPIHHPSGTVPMHCIHIQLLELSKTKKETKN